MYQENLLEQNSLSQNFDPSLDLHEREKAVTSKAFEKLNFKPSKLLGKSSYWGSKFIGAIHYIGEFEGKQSVLKIQGIKMNSSEVLMIRSFEAQNNSKILRVPKIYAYLEWSESDNFEAYVMEYIDASSIVGLPAQKDELDRFFEVYREYRKNCLNKPWVKKPSLNIPKLIITSQAKWKQAFLHLFKDNPYWQPEDEKLLEKGLGVLLKGYEQVDLEFQHGHFSRGDVLQTRSGEVVLFSNLLWGWKTPFYDAVFANHWSVFQLTWLKDPTVELVESQRKLWMNKVYSIPQNEKELKLINLALLERALGALRIDAFTFDTNSPIAKHLVEASRQQIEVLIDKVSNAKS